MKKLIMICAVTALSVNAAKVEIPTFEEASKKRIPMQERMLRDGSIVKPNSQKGAVGFVNTTKCVNNSLIDDVILTISTQMRHSIKNVEGKSIDGLPTVADVKASGLDVAVFVVDKQSLPPMLVAPEARWSLVNVNALKAGINDGDSKKFDKRVQCALLRAFAYACGIGTSQFNDNLFCATSVEDFDHHRPDQMVFDMVQRCNKYLSSIGVEQPYTTNYRRACKEGWAPAPTNDVQKAIWEKVHALPKNPLKIAPETKKVSE